MKSTSRSLLLKNLEFFIVLFTLSFYNLSFSQCPTLQPGTDGANVVSFDEFLGVNLRRADPVEFATCVGTVREYHNWDIDEASSCYRIIYKFDDPIEDITWSINDSEGNLVASGGPYELNPDYRIKAFFCPPKIGNYTLMVESENGME